MTDDRKTIPLDLTDVDLSQLRTDDMIAELLKREQAMVIAIIRQDETTGTDEFLTGTFYAGDVANCMYATIKIINSLLVDAELLGVPRRVMKGMVCAIQAEHLFDKVDDEDDDDVYEAGPDNDVGPFPDAPQG